MKILQNKTTDITFSEIAKQNGLQFTGKDRKLKYSDLLSACCDNKPKEGFVTSDMRGRFKIQEACEKAKAKIELEDTDAAASVIIVKAMRWNFKHRDILTFEDDVKKAFA